MRNRCSYAGLVSAYFSMYLAGTKNVSTNTIYSYRDTFVIFHGYLEKYCGFKLEKMLFNDLSRELILRDFLGHESIETTQVYAKANPEARRKALETMDTRMNTPAMPDWNDDPDLKSFLKTL